MPSYITALLKTTVSGTLRLFQTHGSRIPINDHHPDDHGIFVVEKPDGSQYRYNIAEYNATTGWDYSSVLTFENLAVRNNIHKRCQELDRQGVVSQKAKWYGAYYHKELDSGYVNDVAISWTGNVKGWGVFARKNIAEGEFIGEYVGKVKLISFFFSNINPYCFRYPLPLSDWLWFTIDAEHDGKETRFLNHSETPNCESAVMFHQGVYRIGIFALKNIDQGEELTYHYGKTLLGEKRVFHEQ